MNKVFGIGLSHTATKSLNEALNILGLKSIHWPVDRATFHELSAGNYRLSLLNRYDAITDITVAPFYAGLDRAYPGSKFILTLREPESWLKSMQAVNRSWRRFAHMNPARRLLETLWEDLCYYKSLGAFKSAWKKVTQARAAEFIRTATYGGIAFEDETQLIDVYNRHHENVLAYFRGRPDDLLVMGICEGEGWERLCPFLGLPIPAVPFPSIRDVRHQKRKVNVLAGSGTT